MSPTIESRTISALAPRHASWETEREAEWAQTTLARITRQPVRRPAPHARRRRTVGLAVGGVLALTAGTAAAGVGPGGAVKDALLGFIEQPNTTGNGIGELHDPLLVARFDTPQGLFAVWIATSSRGAVCYGMTDATWDGKGVPSKDQLDYGCGGQVLDQGDPDATMPLERPDQLGGFFKDSDGPLVYGVSRYPAATHVRVTADGVDVLLPVRADSHGFGAALPGAGGARAVRLSFLDADGRVLGTTRWVAPVG